MRKWYHNALTGEIDSYNAEGEWTDFPRGTWLAYADYITTGIKSREDAEKWAEDWHACPNCQSSRKGKVGDPCGVCGTVLIGPTQS